MICAVIVTYNQLDDLKKCVYHVQNQSNKVDEILVINNDSRDGTSEWLKTQKDITVITQENSGSSGGQYTGIKYAFDKNYDWIWCLDQDVTPAINSLEKLLLSKAIKNPATGFLSSFIFDPAGKPAFINLPYLERRGDILKIIDESDELPVLSSSFGSVLFSRKAVEKSGFPIKEFFIWGDDVEYTMRIIENGFKGYLIKSSRAVHNLSPNIKDPFPFMEIDHFKTRFAIRNTVYIIRLRNRMIFNSHIRGIAGCFLFLFRLFKNRYSIKGFPGFKYHFIILKYFISGLLFSPPREIHTQ